MQFILDLVGKGYATALTTHEGSQLSVSDRLATVGQLDDFYTYEYNKDGKLTKETEYGAKGKLKNFKTYEYLDKGLTVVKKSIKADGTLYRYSLKRYDAAGNLLESSEYRIK